ncbi:Npun_F5749 family FMN-dependent PPOX-type flavoprotein [Pannus brasiliensis CCIBt3594]|uniref:Npun_F5749 family FMN-dependent PPOX-type flavoprotein n=1 Tax=Pannus brasiliensis CCIBt3594 TaxID=1427578 RepID=A0AAW9QX92_9CHRO
MSDPLAPWRSILSRSLHLNRSLPNARYFQLATLTLDGKPANRTVVFRGFRENTNQLQIITDARSEKISQIHASEWGEICWYFPNTREQFRLSGSIEIISAKDTDSENRKARDRVWRELSDSARIQFAWPCPKRPRDGNPEAFTPAQPSDTEPLENFCLLLFNPVSVDHLQLKGNPQDRVIYTQNDVGEWCVESVNP